VSKGSTCRALLFNYLAHSPQGTWHPSLIKITQRLGIAGESMAFRLLAALAGLGSLAAAQVQPDTSGHRNLTVDLGYAVYQGVLNTTIGLASWKG
jgi:hypothetical protein